MTIGANSSTPRHGGDLALASERYGTPSCGWLDLSTGINPKPYPMRSIPAESFAALPDADALADLIDSARKAYRVPRSVGVIAVPGSETALRLLPYVMPEGNVAVVGPTYRSHAESWSAAGRNVVSVATLDAFPTGTANVVLANPNNPDGRIVSRAALTRSAAVAADRGGMLVVDEAFADLDPEISIVPFLDRTTAIVLRSFGKFFGLPGLRLGFVAGPRAITNRLARLIGDWPVSTAAIEAGRAALADTAWQVDARLLLRQSANRLRALLARHGLEIAGSTDLFVLVEAPNAHSIHQRLAHAGIWTRLFDDRHDWIRFGLPGDAAAFERLDSVLSKTSPSGDRYSQRDSGAHLGTAITYSLVQRESH